MSFSITSVDAFKDCGQHFMAVVTLGCGTSTYTTGGDALSTKVAKIKTKATPFFGHGMASNGATAFYIPATKKVQLWDGTTQFASGGALTGVTVTMQLLIPKA